MHSVWGGRRLSLTRLPCVLSAGWVGPSALSSKVLAPSCGQTGDARAERNPPRSGRAALPSPPFPSTFSRRDRPAGVGAQPGGGGWIGGWRERGRAGRVDGRRVSMSGWTDQEMDKWRETGGKRGGWRVEEGRKAGKRGRDRWMDKQAKGAWMGWVMRTLQLPFETREGSGSLVRGEPQSLRTSP